MGCKTNQNTMRMKKLFFITLFCSVLCAVSLNLSAHTNDSSSEPCQRCGGTGYESNMTKACPYCNRGRVQHFYQCQKCWGEGYILNSQGQKVKCPTCDGAKQIYVDEQCAYCNGTGTVRKECMSCNGRGTKK